MSDKSTGLGQSSASQDLEPSVHSRSGSPQREWLCERLYQENLITTSQYKLFNTQHPIESCSPRQQSPTVSSPAAETAGNRTSRLDQALRLQHECTELRGRLHTMQTAAATSKAKQSASVARLRAEIMGCAETKQVEHGADVSTAKKSVPELSVIDIHERVSPSTPQVMTPTAREKQQEATDRERTQGVHEVAASAEWDLHQEAMRDAVHKEHSQLVHPPTVSLGIEDASARTPPPQGLDGAHRDMEQWRAGDESHVSVGRMAEARTKFNEATRQKLTAKCELKEAVTAEQKEAAEEALQCAEATRRRAYKAMLAAQEDVNADLDLLKQRELRARKRAEASEAKVLIANTMLAMSDDPKVAEAGAVRIERETPVRDAGALNMLHKSQCELMNLQELEASARERAVDADMRAANAERRLCEEVVRDIVREEQSSYLQATVVADDLAQRAATMHMDIPEVPLMPPPAPWVSGTTNPRQLRRRPARYPQDEFEADARMWNSPPTGKEAQMMQLEHEVAHAECIMAEEKRLLELEAEDHQWHKYITGRLAAVSHGVHTPRIPPVPCSSPIRHIDMLGESFHLHVPREHDMEHRIEHESPQVHPDLRSIEAILAAKKLAEGRVDTETLEIVETQSADEGIATLYKQALDKKGKYYSVDELMQDHSTSDAGDSVGFLAARLRASQSYSGLLVYHLYTTGVCYISELFVTPVDTLHDTGVARLLLRALLARQLVPTSSNRRVQIGVERLDIDARQLCMSEGFEIVDGLGSHSPHTLVVMEYKRVAEQRCIGIDNQYSLLKAYRKGMLPEPTDWDGVSTLRTRDEYHDTLSAPNEKCDAADAPLTTSTDDPEFVIDLGLCIRLLEQRLSRLCKDRPGVIVMLLCIVVFVIGVVIMIT